MPVGIQMGTNGYGIFGALNVRDPLQMCKIIAEADCDYAEVMFNLQPQARHLAQCASACGIEFAAVHVFWWELWDKFADVVEFCRTLSCPRVIVSHLPASTLADYRRVARQFTAWSRPLASEGLTLYVHNHAEEVRRYRSGGSGLEIVLGECSPDDVRLCIDTYWATLAGLDVARLMADTMGRWDYLHAHDGVFSDQSRADVSVDLGEGEADLVPALRLAGSVPGCFCVAERKFVPEDSSVACKRDVQYLRRHLSTPCRPGDGLR